MDAQPEATLADDEAQLAAFALDLGDRIEAAIPDWVERSLRARGGAAFDAVAAATIEAKTFDAATPLVVTPPLETPDGG